MAKKIKIFLSFLIISSLFFFSGCLKPAGKEVYSLNLEIWGVFDDGGAYNQAFQAYREINPFVKEAKYRKFDINDYKKDLINALAAGTGPDIFFIQNSWLPEFIDKVAPL